MGNLFTEIGNVSADPETIDIAKESGCFNSFLYAIFWNIARYSVTIFQTDGASTASNDV